MLLVAVATLSLRVQAQSPDSSHRTDTFEDQGSPASRCARRGL